jgi:hypothetical protein
MVRAAGLRAGARHADALYEDKPVIVDGNS